MTNWHPNWKPYPQFPRHIADLAAAVIYEDKTAVPALHDALVEIGLPLCAKLVMTDVMYGCSNQITGFTNSLILGILVGDGYEDWKDEEKRFIFSDTAKQVFIELDAYMESRR